MPVPGITNVPAKKEIENSKIEFQNNIESKDAKGLSSFKNEIITESKENNPKSGKNEAKSTTMKIESPKLYEGKNAKNSTLKDPKE